MSHTLIDPPTVTVKTFIDRWRNSGASERANYQLFLTELCALLGVENPRPSSDRNHQNTYCFERPVTFDDGEGKTSTGFTDLYKKDCFVLEAKQGSDRPAETEAEIFGGASLKRKAGTARRETHRVGPLHEAGKGAGPALRPQPAHR